MGRAVIRLLLCGWLALSALAAQAGGLFLWQAERAGQRVWLLGSVHLGRADFYPLAAPIERAYADAPRIAVEADISNPAAVQDLAAQTRLPEGQTLNDLLDSERQAKLARVLQRLGLPLAAVQHSKPAFLAIALAGLDMQRKGLLPQYGIDMHFLLRAHADGKPVVELESVPGQFAMLNTLPADDALALYDATLAPLVEDELASQLDAMLHAWQSGDAAAMQAVIEAGLPDEPALKRVNARLFTERNRAMADRIATLAGQPAPLVIVGAGHLVGPDSLPALLRARGFRVQQY